MRKIWSGVLLIGLLLLAGCANVQAATTRREAVTVAASALKARYKQSFTLIAVQHYRRGGALQATFAGPTGKAQPVAVTLTASGQLRDDYRKYQVLPLLCQELTRRLAAYPAARGAEFDLAGETHLTLPKTISLDDYLDNVAPLPVVTLHCDPGTRPVLAGAVWPVYQSLAARFPQFRLVVWTGAHERLTVRAPLHHHWLTQAELARAINS
ncbi:hypothetical protein [Lacticaseibacillus daqingensis]|uniref:hypothetical protein n=1 Tax=Lacticaseibacillus daqingensis TaxID=2486014 RepID=UPI000F771749|nr:hypothetical protein [Lacticaseibacillus daqingensis]